MRTLAYSRFLSAIVALVLALPLGGMAIPAAHADYMQCSDGMDNDSDGQIDYPEDANCDSISDNTEWADNGIFVTVTDGREEIAPGEAAQYQITLKQQRDPVQLIDVSFHVPVQSGITYASNDGSITDGTTVRWYKVAVFKGHARHLAVHAVISPNATEGRLLVTRVTANGSTANDTTMVKNTNNIPYVQNMLQVSIDDHRDRAQPGDILEYLVTVRNPEKRGVTVHTRVTIPAALRVTDAAGADFLGNELVWKNVTINPNQERTFTFRAQVNDRLPKSYPIQVTARAGNVVAYDRTVTGGTPYSLFTSITDNRDFAERGDLLTYVVHVDNTSGRLDTNASIDASLPQYSEFVSVTEGGQWDGNNVRWLRMQIAPGSSRDLMFTVRVRSDAPDGNLMRATAMTQGYTAVDITQVGGGNANGYYRAPVGGSPYDASTISVRKTADRTSATAGSTVRYTLTVRNVSNSEARSVTVNDAYDPSVFTITDAGLGNVQDGRITWYIDSLQAGEVRTFTYSGVVSRYLKSGASVLNTARAYIQSSDVGYVPAAGEYIDPYSDQYLLPVTGIGDFFSPLENSRQFLTPIAAAAEGNGLPLVVWMGVMMIGLVSGGMMSKKYLA